MKTIAQLVDDNDNEIEVKDGDALNRADIYRVSLLWIVNDKNEILLAQRSLEKTKDPGLWGGSAAGTVEQGETYESNIRKEAQEELGLTLGELEVGPKQRVTGQFNYFAQHFIARMNPDLSDLILQADEVETVKWFDASDLAVLIGAEPQKFGFKFGSLFETVRNKFSEL